MNDKSNYPRRVRCKDNDVELRLMGADDEAAVVEFAGELPVHDVLFLKRDIRNPKVVAAWLESIERGTIASVLALLASAAPGGLRPASGRKVRRGHVRQDTTPAHGAGSAGRSSRSVLRRGALRQPGDGLLELGVAPGAGLVLHPGLLRPPLRLLRARRSLLPLPGS